MSFPLLSIIIPTHNRPHLLPLAFESALKQTVSEIEVIVVDDGSSEPVSLPDDSRLQVIRLARSRGGAAARNIGTQAAQGRWITYLDDDDTLLPQMAEVSLEALEKTNLPPPVAVISGIEVVNLEGQILKKRLPPPLRSRGCHFSLEEREPGKSYNTKQTLVVERDVINQIGGWDESFRSRVHTELFLRLNAVCTLIGLSVPTYRLLRDQQARVSQNTNLRQESFHRLVQKHKEIFEAHPKMFSEFVYNEALISYKLGKKKAALAQLLWSFKLHPVHISRLAFRPAFISN